MSVLGNMALDQLQALNALHMSTAMILFLFTNGFSFYQWMHGLPTQSNDFMTWIL